MNSQVVVQPGDNLWLIAAARLNRDDADPAEAGQHADAGTTDAGTGVDAATIAAQWPRWYAANRSLIGPDPGLLIPGQRLTVPAAGS